MVTIDRDHLNRRKTVATTTKKVADQGLMRLSFQVVFHLIEKIPVSGDSVVGIEFIMLK